MIKDWLMQLNEAIDCVDSGFSINAIDIKRNKLKDIYSLYSYEEKEELHRRIIDIVFPMNSDSSTLWFLFFITPIIDSNLVVNLINEWMSISDSDIYKRSSIEFQLKCITIEVDYNILRRTHELVLEKEKDLLTETYSNIPPDQRNKDTIVLFTAQILDLNHSPTKKVLDYFIYLKEKLNKNVYLISIPISSSLSDRECFDRKELCYDEDLNGRSGMIYQGITIPIYQVLFHEKNLKEIQNIIQVVYELKPMFVMSMGDLAPIFGIISKFTTVVADNMTVMYPVSNVQILLKYGMSQVSELERNIENRNQKVVFVEPSVELVPPAKCISKEQLKIPKEAFAIALVGTRLGKEIDKNFITFLQNIVNMEPKIFYVVIGEMNNYDYLFKELDEKNKSIFIGVQKDLTSVLGAMDLFLNPRRKGGGYSSLMSLKAGTPVVTLDDCDVAFNVGSDFICSDENEEIETIIRYVRSNEFYESQVKKGIERMEKVSDIETNNKKALDRIYEIINQELSL